ncbi:MAG: hypothetical protein QNJ71_00585 [Acidimicrobiia bacterium]|nr:hypothetical protein [Acidimicrobiia bacterium]
MSAPVRPGAATAGGSLLRLIVPLIIFGVLAATTGGFGAFLVVGILMLLVLRTVSRAAMRTTGGAGSPSHITVTADRVILTSAGRNRPTTDRAISMSDIAEFEVGSGSNPTIELELGDGSEIRLNLSRADAQAVGEALRTVIPQRED